MSSCEFLCCISILSSISLGYSNVLGAQCPHTSSVLIHQAPIACHAAQHPLQPQRRAHQHPRGGARAQHDSQEATRRLGSRHLAHVAALHRRTAHTLTTSARARAHPFRAATRPLPTRASPREAGRAPRARCRADCPRRPRPRPRRRATTSRRS
ncbi:hypothetical protein B0H14DRAFT_1217667 [Mycena olivaceomarginata]|nr:hypothetical protein B0H14DRAFT_1217667 [Mycena olivaceomarginata]